MILNKIMSAYAILIFIRKKYEYEYEMKYIVFLLLFITTLHATDIEMKKDYAKAYSTAKSAKKPLLIYIYQKGCMTCKYMDSHVFSDERVKKYLKQHYIVAHITTHDRALPKAFHSSMSPAFHIVNSQNEEMIESIIGGRDVKKFLKLLKRSYQDYKDEIN